MKKSAKLIAVAFTAAALFSTSNVKAQTTPVSAWRFGIGLETGVPTGQEASRGTFELGGTARLQYGVSNNLAITLTSGLYNFFGKDIPGTNTKYPDLDVIPLKAGIKAFVAPNIYFGAEAGAGFVQNNGNTKLLLSPAVGYANKHWDVGVRYENFSGQDVSYGLVGLRLAYAFSL
jgi:hypothetical protein